MRMYLCFQFIMRKKNTPKDSLRKFPKIHGKANDKICLKALLSDKSDSKTVKHIFNIASNQKGYTQSCSNLQHTILQLSLPALCALWQGSRDTENIFIR